MVSYGKGLTSVIVLMNYIIPLPSGHVTSKTRKTVHLNESRLSGAIAVTYFWGEGGLVWVTFLQGFLIFFILEINIIWLSFCSNNLMNVKSFLMKKKHDFASK